jgi:hypothetical protein
MSFMAGGAAPFLPQLREPVRQEPGWWKVVDRHGDPAFYEFREDGRARMLRQRWWDWCRVQGEWTRMSDPEWLKWANLDSKPAAVFGSHDFLARLRDDPEREQER